MCFLDETGQGLRPPRARTWGRRGRTPVVRVPGRGGNGRVSVVGMVCYRPGWRPRLLYRARTWRGGGGRRGIGWEDCRDLLAAAHAQLPGGRLVLVWDRVNIHRQTEMTTFLREHAGWVSAVLLPAYAPELNPAEGVWSQLKRTAVVNLAARALDEVCQAVKHGLKRMQYRPPLLLGFLAETGLVWEELWST
ncbi:transposase [Frankia sp. Allo2]|uniref:transposase n=1 Tax=Frankia sp. Allo2 TaxID=981405 RepID=UPI00350E9651